MRLCAASVSVSVFAVVAALPVGAAPIVGGTANQGLLVEGESQVGARLADSIVVDSNIAGSNFSEADFADSIFLRTNIANSDFRAAGFVKATFDDVNIAGSVFDEALLEGAVFDGVNITGTSFVGADLDNAVFDGVNLSGIDFGGASLADVIFRDVVLSNVSFRGADLRCAHCLEHVKGVGIYDEFTRFDDSFNPEEHGWVFVPSVPAPGAAVVMGFAGLCGATKRRRAA